MLLPGTCGCVFGLFYLVILLLIIFFYSPEITQRLRTKGNLRVFLISVIILTAIISYIASPVYPIALGIIVVFLSAPQRRRGNYEAAGGYGRTVMGGPFNIKKFDENLDEMETEFKTAGFMMWTGTFTLITGLVCLVLLF
ncbi:MAG: hypothetical protein R6U61_06440 [Thermoplasmata archaeon]